MSTLIVKNLNLSSKNIFGQEDYKKHTLTVLDKLLKEGKKLYILNNLFHQEENDISYIDKVRDRLNSFEEVVLYSDKLKELEEYFEEQETIKVEPLENLDTELDLSDLGSATRYKYDDTKKDIGGNFYDVDSSSIKQLSLEPYSDTFNSANIFKLKKREKNYEAFSEAIVNLDSNNSQDVTIDLDDDTEYGRVKREIMQGKYKYSKEEEKCLTITQ